MKIIINGNHFFEVSSPFGAIDSVHKKPHTGIDLAIPEGTKIYSATDGIVQKIVDYGNENIGKGIIIKTDDNETLILGHLSEIKVGKGEMIDEGDLLGLSGNTGHSTGAHLHIGLKDDNGKFIDPTNYLQSNELVTLNNPPDESMFDKIDSFMDFISTVREHGIFYAIYGKSFFQVCKDFVINFFNELSKFVLQNSDFFFLFPAILIMFITFIIGRNKYTKYIIPLWFAYFVSRILYFTII